MRAYLTLQPYNSCAELRLVENILDNLNANQTINLLFSKPTCLALLGANTWSRRLVIINTYYLLLSNEDLLSNKYYCNCLIVVNCIVVQPYDGIRESLRI